MIGDCETNYMLCCLHKLQTVLQSLKIDIIKKLEEIMETIKIKYFSDKIDKLEYIGGKSDWIDLRASEEVSLKKESLLLFRLEWE